MPSKNSEEIQFEPLQDSQPEPTGEERIRPGLLGMNWKVLLWLAAVGLVPLLMILPVLLPLTRTSPQVHQKFVEQAENLRRRAAELQHSLADLKKEIAGQKITREQDAYEQSARRSYRDLHKKLAALIPAEKKLEEISADKGIKSAVESAAGPFSEIALVETGTHKVLFSKFTPPAGSLEKTFPVLHKAFSADTPPAKLNAGGWHWGAVGKTPLALVVYTPEFKPEASPPSASPETQIAALEAAELDEFDNRLAKWTWILAIALPLLAMVLAACAFLWLRAGLLAPLSRITRGARTVLHSPDELTEEQLERPGLLEDLAATLNRTAVRMRRLDQQDREAVERHNQILSIEQTLNRAVSGDLGSRAPVEAGECETLALGVNRLLESLLERSQAVAQAGSRLKSSAERLRGLADQLGKTLAPGSGDRPPVDPAPLGAILGVQLETLCQSVGEIAAGFKDAPRKWTPENHEALSGAMGSSRAGLQVLAQRTREARTASQRMGDLRQAAEVLSTNLAIAAEARSWSRLDELTDDARNLSREIVEFSGSLAGCLENVSRSGDELKDTLQQATDLGIQCEDLVEGWESLRADLERRRKDLLRQIEAIRPGAGSLGSDVRSISQRLSEYRKISTDKQDMLLGVAESTDELSRTAGEVLSLLKKLSASEPTHAAPTPELAARQQALEKAIRDISNLAAKEGIESLSEDARNIINQIRAAAEAAKKRVLREPEADT
jgi:methyl-accepting chemotaxis protein